jgi:hypothetical protein
LRRNERAFDKAVVVALYALASDVMGGSELDLKARWFSSDWMQ